MHYVKKSCLMQGVRVAFTKYLLIYPVLKLYQFF